MIIIKSSREIEYIREASRIVVKVLRAVEKLIKPGIKTIELDEFAYDLIIKHNAKPAFKGYRGYKYTLCTSVNESIVHELPGEKALKSGDIVSVDVGVIYKGYYGDGAATFAVGEISELKKRLIEVTYQALYGAIEKARPGNHLTDISYTIQKYAEENGFAPIREFCGHGVGVKLHEDPEILNYGEPGKGPLLRPGMTLAIEPMISAGKWQSKILKDKWTAVTIDKSPVAHFEHTILITEDGNEILTIDEEGDVHPYWLESLYRP